MSALKLLPLGLQLEGEGSIGEEGCTGVFTLQLSLLCSPGKVGYLVVTKGSVLTRLTQSRSGYVGSYPEVIQGINSLYLLRN